MYVCMHACMCVGVCVCVCVCVYVCTYIYGVRPEGGAFKNPGLAGSSGAWGVCTDSLRPVAE